MTSEILTVSAYPGPGKSQVLVIAGEIDRDTRAVLREAADRALQDGPDLLVLDLAGVTFCDSSGLSLFVDLYRQREADSGRVALAAASPSLRDMLRITRLDRLFPPYATVEEVTGRS
jgi:anti-sigma B factor antagonist